MKFLEKLGYKIRAKQAEHGCACDSCGREIFSYPHPRLCIDCEKKIWKNNQTACPKCGRKTLADGVCLDCKSRMPNFDKGVSVFVYFGETAALINRFKNGNRHLGFYFAESLADKLLAEIPFSAPPLLIAVPTTDKKYQERGFNQAQDLAVILTDCLKKRGVHAEFDNEILQKRKETSAQKHMTLAQRAQNVSGAYHVHKRKACRDRVVVLVDDIMTTGATGSECAKLLLGAGAKEVIFASVASLSEQR